MSAEASHPLQVHSRCWTINISGRLTEITANAVLMWPTYLRNAHGRVVGRKTTEILSPHNVSTACFSLGLLPSKTAGTEGTEGPFRGCQLFFSGSCPCIALGYSHCPGINVGIRTQEKKVEARAMIHKADGRQVEEMGQRHLWKSPTVWEKGKLGMRQVCWMVSFPWGSQCYPLKTPVSSCFSWPKSLHYLPLSLGVKFKFLTQDHKTLTRPLTSEPLWAPATLTSWLSLQHKHPLALLFVVPGCSSMKWPCGYSLTWFSSLFKSCVLEDSPPSAATTL